MCPHRKLKWFADRNFEMDPLRSRVVLRYEELYPFGSRQDSPPPVQQEYWVCLQLTISFFNYCNILFFLVYR
jgi:hypothetical protein